MTDVWCQMSDITHLMSNFWCLVFVIWCHMSDVRCMMSDVWCQMFHVIYLMSGVCCLMSDVWRLVSRVWYNFMMSDIWCLMSDVWCLMPDIWGQTSDVWCIISDYMLAINSSHGHAFVFVSLHLQHIINPLLNKKSSIKPPLSYKPPTLSGEES